MQAESRKMMERYMDESKKRAEMLEQVSFVYFLLFTFICLHLYVYFCLPSRRRG